MKKVLLTLGGITVLGVVAYLAYSYFSKNETQQSTHVIDDTARTVASYAGVAAENLVATPFNEVAKSQNKSTGDLYRETVQKAIDAVVQEKRSEGALPSGSGRNVAVEVVRPQVDESQTSNSKNKTTTMVNPTTGKVETVRDVFRQSYKPTGVNLSSVPSGARSSSLNKPAGTLSKTKTAGTGKSAGTSKGGKK